jgi:hypothetical protein
MNRNLRWLVPLAVLSALAIALYLWLSPRDPSAQAPPAPEAATEDSGPPAVRHPIEAVQPDAAGEPPVDAAPPPLPSLADSDSAVDAALQGLIGQQAVLDLLTSGPRIRHLAATVDNLPRKKAPTRAWPVKRTPGRFTVEESDGTAYIAAENFARYTPFVDTMTSTDTGRAVALYVRFYPLLQQAYEDLGYPGKYFNDRVVEVIDHLLATPEPDGPIPVVLPPHDTSTEFERPWTLYQFADSRLESLSAGQKILLRMGPENASRLKEKLTELRSCGHGWRRNHRRPRRWMRQGMLNYITSDVEVQA